MVLFTMSLPLLAQSYSKELEKAAKKGDVASQLAVANAYYNGDGVTANTDKAAQWYYKAAVAGNDEAKQKLYSFYSKSLEKFAKEGDAQAQYEVGMDYLEMKDLKNNTEVAGKWFLAAKNQGHADATSKLYSFYSKSLELAAKEGDAQAQYEVGMDYLEMKDLKNNTEVAGKWFLAAKNQGHADATSKLYSFYSKSLELAAKEGDAQAQYEVGMDYLEGNGVAKKAATAAMWLDKAKAQGHKEATDKFYKFYSKQLETYAKSGDAKAQYWVGEAYLNGIEVDQNYRNAAKYFYKATLQNYSPAKTKLYSFYSKELKKLAKEKDVEAQYALGLAYYNGVGTEKSDDDAGDYFAMAYDNGHQKAGELLYSFDSYARRKRIISWYNNENGIKIEVPKDPGLPFKITKGTTEIACGTVYRTELSKNKYGQIHGIAIAAKIEKTNLSSNLGLIDVSDSDALIFFDRAYWCNAYTKENHYFNEGESFAITIFPSESSIVKIPEVYGNARFVITEVENKENLSLSGTEVNNITLSSVDFAPCNGGYNLPEYLPLEQSNIKNVSVKYGTVPYKHAIAREGKTWRDAYFKIALNNGDTIQLYQYEPITKAVVCSYRSADGKFKYDRDIEYNIYSAPPESFYKEFSDGAIFEYNELDKFTGILPDGTPFIWNVGRSDDFDAYELIKFETFYSLRNCENKEEFLNMVMNVSDDSQFERIREYHKEEKIKGFDYDLHKPNYKIALTTIKNGEYRALTFIGRSYTISAKQHDILQKDFDKRVNAYFQKLNSKYGKANVDAIRNAQLRKGMPFELVKEFYNVGWNSFWQGYELSRVGFRAYIVFVSNNKVTSWRSY